MTMADSAVLQRRETAIIQGSSRVRGSLRSPVRADVTRWCEHGKSHREGAVN